MIKSTLLIIASLSLGIILGPNSDGATFELNFTASNFSAAFGSPAAPNDPVSGSLVWEAAGIREPILSLDSISLTLDGHNYAVSEIGYDRADFPYNGIELVGGTINGLNTMVA